MNDAAPLRELGLANAEQFTERLLHRLSACLMSRFFTTIWRATSASWGDLEKAKTTLHTAFKLQPQYRVMALDDDDLKPLWEGIEAI